MKQHPYSMDSDPDGIRERVSVTISGAIALHAQNESTPPDGHWLTEFWYIGRNADQWRSAVWAVGRALNCLPSTYAAANGHILRAAEKLTAERDALKAEVERLRSLSAAQVRDALEEAARQCEAVKDECERLARGADSGMYDHQAQGAENCAEAVRIFSAATAV